ncbi:MAG: hypothetical protein WB791_01140 [Waddliaceae bacterium]
MSSTNFHSFTPNQPVERFRFEDKNITESQRVSSYTDETTKRAANDCFDAFSSQEKFETIKSKRQHSFLTHEQLREIPSLFIPGISAASKAAPESTSSERRTIEKEKSIPGTVKKRRLPGNQTTAQTSGGKGNPPHRDASREIKRQKAENSQGQPPKKIKHISCSLFESPNQPASEGFKELCGYLSLKYPDFDLSSFKTIEDFQKAGHPFHFAIKENDMVLLHYLIKAGADVNQRHEGRTVFDLLMERKVQYGLSPQVEHAIISLIENGLNVNESDNNFDDSNLKRIVEACSGHNFNLIKYLFMKENDFVKQNASDMAHTLIENKSLEEFEVIELLSYLFLQGLNVDKPDKVGRTLLHKAVDRCDLNLVERLLKLYNANPTLMRKLGRNMGPKTPLELAMETKVQLEQIRYNLIKLLPVVVNTERYLFLKTLNKEISSEIPLAQLELLEDEYREFYSSKKPEDKDLHQLALKKKEKIKDQFYRVCKSIRNTEAIIDLLNNAQ